MNNRNNNRGDSDQRDWGHRSSGETQGGRDTSLRGFGGNGFSYDYDDPPHKRAGPRTGQNEAPYAPGEFYGSERHGGSRDPKSMSSVGWGGEGGGFSGDPRHFGDDRPGYGRRHAGEQAGGGVLSGVPNHRGRGPKGYLRSDERIADDVHHRLTDDHDVDASDITVLVQKGEVTLTGHVATRRMKRRAEDIVADCGGVRDVHNHLRIGTAEESGRQ
ncbi:MAG TPA: BON domain-containing protein [Pseudoxanthomonas sp.]|nr:BON domain-containing protein [Pseudoxanthomonas sp.]